MKPQRDPNAASVIPPLHPDTIAVERYLCDFSPGQEVAMERLAALARVDWNDDRRRAAFSNHVSSAIRRLRNGKGMVFSRRDGLVVLLDDDGIKNAVADCIRRAGRVTKKAVSLSEHVNVEALTADARDELFTAVAQAKGAGLFLATKNGKLLLGLVNTTHRIPALEDSWKALGGAG